jgi:hypothetical protein
MNDYIFQYETWCLNLKVSPTFHYK